MTIVSSLNEILPTAPNVVVLVRLNMPQCQAEASQGQSANQITTGLSLILTNSCIDGERPNAQVTTGS